MTQQWSQNPAWGLIEVTGRDAAGFLHRQLSNDILALPEPGACLATYNTAQGRVIATLVVMHWRQSYWLMAATDLVEILVTKLSRYILRDDVKLQKSSLNVAVALAESQLVKPAEQAWPLSLETTAEAAALQVKLPYGAILRVAETMAEVDDGLLQKVRRAAITQGFAHIQQATTEAFVAQMLNQQFWGALNFSKGCYPGQEVIARAQYRGQVRRGLACLCAASAMVIGDEISDGSQNVGKVVDVVSAAAGSLILAVIRYGAEKHCLTCQDQPLTLKQIFFQNEGDDQ